MTISNSFREFAEKQPDLLSPVISKEMINAGYNFTQFRGSDYSIPDPSWESIVDNLGGIEAIDAEYDGSNMFTVKHIKTGIEITSNGPVDALASLWLAIKKY
jgi:hypothetical protein